MFCNKSDKLDRICFVCLSCGHLKVFICLVTKHRNNNSHGFKIESCETSDNVHCNLH